MKQFFAPVGVFVAGMVALLAMFIVWPAVDTATVNLAGNTTAIASNYWGWSWLMTTGVVRYLAFGFGFLAVCFFTGVTFLKTKARF